MFFHDTVGLAGAWSIVALTVVVRAALLPLTLKQFKSMQNMVRLQPEIKGLQAKYKDDRERLNQEMMKFYRENKVNPFASCLPLLAQLPVFLALFYMLQDDLRLDICPDDQPAGYREPAAVRRRGEREFLFIPDLTDKATGGVLMALIVLYVGSQLLSTLLMSTATDRTQRMHLPRAAVLLRDLRDQLPGGPARVLDHDEPLDDRAADDRAQAARSDATTRRRRAATDVDHGPDAPRPRRQAPTTAPAAGRVAVAPRAASGGGSGEAAARPKAPQAAARRLRRRRARRRSAPGGADERRPRPAGRARPRAARGGQRRAGPRRRGRGRASEDGRDPRRARTATTSGLFIGRHGQTIDAVQHLAFKVAAHGPPPAPRVEVDAAGLPRAPPRRRSSARPTRPPPTRSAAAARWRSTR